MHWLSVVVCFPSCVLVVLFHSFLPIAVVCCKYSGVVARVNGLWKQMWEVRITGKMYLMNGEKYDGMCEKCRHAGREIYMLIFFTRCCRGTYTTSRNICKR